MSNTVKGKKGFQSKPKSKKQERRCVFYLTDEQHARLTKYCIKNNIFAGALVKERIKDIIKD